MRKIEKFEEYMESLAAEQRELADAFFEAFDSHVILPKREKKVMRRDFENAILYYINNGVELDDALSRVDIKNLGGFYARPPILWYPLDDAAKIYPLSMEHGRMSVFRMSVYFKSQVVPELLQLALGFTIKRFPSFATTLKKGFFWHYLDTSKRRYGVEAESLIPCQPMSISQSGAPAFRVMYFENRVSVEFFHVLTDGTGGMTFLKCLISEYLRLMGITADEDVGIWDANEAPHPDEIANEFAQVEHPKTSTPFMDKTAVQLGGKLTKNKPHCVLHFKMNTEHLKKAAEKYNCTVTAYILSLMFVAGRFATDELSGEMNIQVPVNMRKFYPSRTVRNFSMYCGIRLDLKEISDVESVVSVVSAQLSQKTAQEQVSRMLTSTERLVNSLVWVPLVIKLPVARLIYGFLGDKSFSNTLSNIGVVKMPTSFSEYIDSFDFVLGTAITNRVSCAMVTFNNTTTLSIVKNTVDPSFEERLYDLLLNAEIELEVEGSKKYES